MDLSQGSNHKWQAHKENLHPQNSVSLFACVPLYVCSACLCMCEDESRYIHLENQTASKCATVTGEKPAALLWKYFWSVCTFVPFLCCCMCCVLIFLSARFCLFFVTHSYSVVVDLGRVFFFHWIKICNQGLMGRSDQSGPTCFFRRYRSFSDGHFSDNRCMTQEHLQPTQTKISSSQSENSSPTAVELPLVLFLKYCSPKNPLLCLLLFSATSFKSSSVTNAPFVHIL